MQAHSLAALAVLMLASPLAVHAQVAEGPLGNGAPETQTEPEGPAPRRSPPAGILVPSADRYLIGVGVEMLQPGVHKLLDIEEGAGLLVMRVMPEGPAARAGVEPHDLILFVNGALAAAPNDLVRMINEGQGAPVKLTLRRGSETRELEVTPERAGPGMAMLVERLPFPAPAAAPGGGLPQERPPLMPESLEFDLVGPGMLPAAGDSSVQIAELRREMAALREQQEKLAEHLRELIEQLRTAPAPDKRP